MVKTFFESVFRMGVTIIVLCGGFTACRDHASPESASVRQRTASTAGVRKASSLKHELAWVGHAHNKALDDLRAEMRKPGILTNDVCAYVARFAADIDRLPPEKARGNAKDRQSIAQAVQKDGKHCKADPVSTVVKQDDGTYTNISALATQIDSEIDLATDRYDLARRLSPLWSAAAALSESEAAIVASTLATAQSSFEYWEVEVDRAYREFEAEYADCIRSSSSGGQDYDQAYQYCLDGGVLPTVAPRYAPQPTRIAGMLAPRGCALGGHFKNLAKADAGGAFVGAIKGAISGGVAGIAGGALVGGITGSAGSWFNSAWELYKCAVT